MTLSDTETVKEELQSLRVEISTFKDFVMAESLDTEMYKNEINISSRNGYLGQ